MKSFRQLTEVVIKLGSKEASHVDRFLDDLHATTEPHPFDSSARVVNGNATVNVSKFGGEAHLSDIRSLAPRSGAGTSALKHLTSLADKHGVRISGTAKAYHPDKKYIGSSSHLAQWYGQHGFTVDDGDDDYGYDITYHPRKS